MQQPPPANPAPSDRPLPELGRAPADDTEVDTDLGHRLAYLRLGSEDAARLRELLGLLRGYADQFVRDFYDHLLGFPETARFLSDPAVVETLKQKQKDHFESMLAARWDERYVEQRLHVGDRHAEIGVAPELFLGAFAEYLRGSLHFLADQRRDVPSDFLDQVLSLGRAMLLDIGLALDAYFNRSTRNLRHALDMLWRANAELRRFAQLASHDLKTPLGTVANLCDEAIDEFGDRMPREARELIAAARMRCFRMSAMIDELLSVATAGVVSEGNDDVHSEQVVDEVVERLLPVVTRSGVKLTIHRPLPSVVGNRVRLREAFYNLLSNAVKFVEPQRGRVDVGAEVRGDRCRFFVADNGPGIPVQERERIFSPFLRLPMHEGQPGSGLGLYFTRTLIEQQGGRVWVESEEGQGSRFIIELPRRID